MRCVVCDKEKSSNVSHKCLYCPLRFCQDCGEIRKLCDDCYNVYGKLYNTKKFKKLKN